MNKFFFQLRLFLDRLHFVILGFWIIWEALGYGLEFDTPTKILSQSFEIEIPVALTILLFLLVISFTVWRYLVGSFVDEDEILAERLKLENDELVTQYRDAEFKKEKRKEKIFWIVLLIFIVLVVFSN